MNERVTTEKAVVGVTKHPVLVFLEEYAVGILLVSFVQDRRGMWSG